MEHKCPKCGGHMLTKQSLKFRDEMRKDLIKFGIIEE